jgi:hypothetical protein
MYQGPSSGIVNRIARAIHSARDGLKFGYPLCCVLNYSLDLLLGIPSGLSRGEIADFRAGPHVPCHFHKRVKKSLSRTQCLQLLDTGSLVEHLAPQSTVETRVDGRVVASVQVPDGMRGVFLQQLRLDSA